MAAELGSIGTPLSTSATRVLFCGAGELGKEVIIEMMRLGAETIAVDRYANAPGMTLCCIWSQQPTARNSSTRQPTTRKDTNRPTRRD